MAVSDICLAIRYAGEDKTQFDIPFPFLERSHILAAISADGEAPPVLLPLSAYAVGNDAQGHPVVTTHAPVPSGAAIVIFRNVPLTQPTVFQPAGPFPAKANETALDRLLMQVQQLNRRINNVAGLPSEDYVEVPGSSPDNARDVATWANGDARGGIRPRWTGQLGVERENGSVWIGQSTTPGDWQEFRPRRTDHLTLGVVADGGLRNSYQTGIASLLASWQPDAVLFAGDNNYSGAAGYANDWLAFQPFISGGKAFPALGNHDLDVPGYEALHNAKFPYLTPPGEQRRYYTVTLGDGLVDLFVLNSGLDSIGDLIEPDGNDAESDQHEWFVSQLAKSKARWKIAMFHHPPATLVDGDDRVSPEMNWPEFEQMDLIICGHTHALELLKWKNTMLLNASASVQPSRPVEAMLQGVDLATAWPLWADDENRGLARIVASQERLEVEVWRTDGALLHARSFDDFSARPCNQEHYKVLPSNQTIAVLDHEYISTVAAPSMLRRVMVSLNQLGAQPTPWTVYAGNVPIANGLIPGGQTFSVAPSLVPLEMIPRGTPFTISTSIAYGSTAPDARGLDVHLFIQRHQ